MVTMFPAIEMDVPSPMILAVEDIHNTETIRTLRVLALVTPWRGLAMVRHNILGNRDLVYPQTAILSPMTLAIKNKLASQIGLPTQVLPLQLESHTQVLAA
jgi:hypothetical protein